MFEFVVEGLGFMVGLRAKDLQGLLVGDAAESAALVRMLEVGAGFRVASEFRVEGLGFEVWLNAKELQGLLVGGTAQSAELWRMLEVGAGFRVSGSWI